MGKRNTNEQLFNEAKAVMKRIGLPVTQDEVLKDSWGFSTGVIHFDGGPGEIIKVGYTCRTQYILISDTLAWPVSEEKILWVPEIINKLNSFQAGGTFYFDEERRVVEVGGGFWVNASSLDEVSFERNLAYVMKMGEKLFPIVLDFLTGSKTKQDVFSHIDAIKMRETENEEKKQEDKQK